MSRGSRLAMASLVDALLVMTVTACDRKGDLQFENSGSRDVTVMAGDETLTVPGSGGVTIIHYGCTSGDITVKFASGREVLLAGPVCPDKRVIISESTASLDIS